MSAITDLKKSRAAKSAPVKLGQWHADFTTVKNYAVKNKVPLFAAWLNDTCGHCVTFAQCCNSSAFKTWAKSSGVALWCGFGSDTSKEDKLGGTGYKFCLGNLKLYPLVRLYWPAGKVDVNKTGDDWDGKSSKGGATLVKQLKNYLKNYKPQAAAAPAAPATPTVPVLGYDKDGEDSCVLTVDDKVVVPEAVAKQVVERYNSVK